MSIVVGSHRVGFSNVAQQQYNANTHPRWEWSPGPRTPAFATTHTQKQTPNKTVRSTGLSSHHCRPPVGVAPRAANSSIRHNTQASKKKPNKTVRPTGLSSHHCRPPAVYPHQHEVLTASCTMPDIFHSERLRRGRKSIIGNAYHIRFSTEDQNNCLSDFDTARSVVLSIAQEHITGRATCICYCIMPDHVHWLMLLRKGTLGNSVSNIKRLSNHLSNNNIPWQRGFYDSGIKDKSILRVTARYIVANPLRAKLVSTVGDYPHWDAIWLGDDQIDLQ